ncbi:MAG: hypothetical protein ACRBHB_12350 [Arenicella sp.]
MGSKIVKDSIDELAIFTSEIEISQKDVPYDLSVAGRLPAEKAFTVCADRLVVTGNLINPGKDLTLIARELIVDSGAMIDSGGPNATKDFTLGDLPQQDNTAFSAKGADGVDGSKALPSGKLSVFAEQINFSQPVQSNDSTLLPMTNWLNSTVKAASAEPKLKEKLDKNAVKGLFMVFKFGIGDGTRVDLKNTFIKGMGSWQSKRVFLENDSRSLHLSIHFTQLSLAGDIAGFGNMTMPFSSEKFAVDAQFELVASDDLEAIYTAGEASASIASDVEINIKGLGNKSLGASAQHALTNGIGDIITTVLAAGVAAVVNKKLRGSNLLLLAQGGQGGRGQDGHSGMPGEKGADGLKTNQHGQISRGVIVGVPDIARGKEGKQGGQAGSAGRSSDGSIGGTLNLGLAQPSAGTFILSSAGGRGAEAAIPGARGPGGKGGFGADVVFNILDNISNQKEIRPAPNGHDGALGPVARFPGNSGADGVKGVTMFNSVELTKAKVFSKQNYAAIAAKFPLTLLQISQNKADLMYLNASTEQEFASVNMRYSWLANITASFAGKTVAAGTGLSAKDIAVRRQMNKAANLELSRLALGLDYYGHALNWVPVLSLGALQARVKDLLDVGKIVEDTFNRYQKKNAKVATRLDNLDHMRSSLEKAIKHDKSEVRDLDEQIEDAFANVEQSLDAANAQRDLILQSEFDYKQAFVTYTLKQNVDCTFEDILITLLDIATFSAELVSGIGQIKAVADATNLFKGADALIKVLKTAKSTEKSISSAIKAIKKTSELGRGQAKVVLEKDEFDKLIAEYLGKFPEAKELHDLVHQYFDLIEAHNNLALGYTALWVMRQRLMEEIAQKEAEMQHIAALRTRQHEAILPEHTAFMERAYWHVKSSLLRKLYEFNRAYYFWSLKPREFKVDDTSIAHLAETYVEWTNDIDKYLSRKGPYQPFQETITITPKTHPSAFAALTNTKRLNFRLDINRQTRASFANMSHIVATKVKLELPDLRPDKGVAFLTLLHSGTSDMNSVARKTKPGGVLSFAHAPREIPYKIDYGNPSNTAGGLIGDKDQGFWGLSPFTVWELNFDNQGNDWINLDDIKKLKLTFEGYFLLGK